MFINYLCEYNKQKLIRRLERVRIIESAVIDLFIGIYKRQLEGKKF